MPQRISLARARDSLARARESESVREMKKRERKSLFLFIIHDLLIPPRSAHSTRPRLAREEAQNSAPRSIAPGQHLLQTGHGSLSSRVRLARLSRPAASNAADSSSLACTRTQAASYTRQSSITVAHRGSTRSKWAQYRTWAALTPNGPW